MLSPYRVLDLADEKGYMCGKVLGDLGADVIKIERPGGDPSRRTGPFWHDEADPEKSLSWFAFNTSKRGITLDIEKRDGQEIFKRLVKSADFVVESFAPGYMDSLSLGYSTLEKINPSVIMVSITPFGQSGPYRDYKSSDIVLWALGNHMYPFGDHDRPPVRVSHEFQAYLNAGVQAAAAAMIALYHRAVTGESQYVSVSIQEVVARLCITASWDQNQNMREREEGRLLPSGNVIRPIFVWPCKDGDIVWFYYPGSQGASRIKPLIDWMDEEGMGDDYLRNLDWETFDFTQTNQEVLDRIAEPTTRFFMSHTKAELFEGALKRRVFLYPVSTVEDIAHSPQLAYREYWVPIEHPELDTTITYPGAFTYSTEAPPRIAHRAPLIGEHNREVYEKELGLSNEELVMLKQAGVI